VHKNIYAFEDITWLLEMKWIKIGKYVLVIGRHGVGILKPTV
jgi:hypothetical protein